MAEHSIYRDIAERTGGDIYIGVVGPVRSGKSTFIKRFMEALVLPNMGDGYSRDRARDEMPQSAAGKTVMTTERHAGKNDRLRRLHRTGCDGNGRKRTASHGTHAVEPGADAFH